MTAVVVRCHDVLDVGRDIMECILVNTV